MRVSSGPASQAPSNGLKSVDTGYQIALGVGYSFGGGAKSGDAKAGGGGDDDGGNTPASGETPSAVSGTTITLRDGANQFELTGQIPELTLAMLNRDTNKAFRV
jgi:hypothetical protein